MASIARRKDPAATPTNTVTRNAKMFLMAGTPKWAGPWSAPVQVWDEAWEGGGPGSGNGSGGSGIGFMYGLECTIGTGPDSELNRGIEGKRATESKERKKDQSWVGQPGD
jgi:hypothetical protein